MRQFITFATAVLATGSLGIVATSTPAHAAADPAVGMDELDTLCDFRGGTADETPSTIYRCREARGTHGYVTEELICERLLDGVFGTAPSHRGGHRTTWTCTPLARPTDVPREPPAIDQRSATSTFHVVGCSGERRLPSDGTPNETEIMT